MKIAILYICTGKYKIFWEKFYKQCKQYFYPNAEKFFYVFTEDEEIIHSNLNDVKVIYQVKSGWPYDTMLRFQWFSAIQDLLARYDYCYYFNANTEFKGCISESNIQLPDANEPLIFWCHTNYKDDYYGEKFNPERNPLSNAYVQEGTKCRCYGGGFFGGTGTAFVTMCLNLRDAILEDLSRGIVAIWHDQSHIIKYAIDKPHKEVEWGLISEEEYIPDADKCLIVFMAKKRFGGNDGLRESNLLTRIKHLPVRIYGRLLDVLHIIHLDNVLKKVVHKLKEKK